MRFEYLDLKELDKALWRYTCECFLDRSADEVQAFIRQYARPIIDATCYVAVEYLSVDEERHVAGVRLLPPTAPEVPRTGPWFRLDPPVGSVAAVAVTGTSYKLMAGRTREAADHAIRVLRIATRAHSWISQRQLRFRLGEAYAFDDRFSGSHTSPDTAYDLTYAGDIADVAESQRVFKLPQVTRNRMERQADLAVRWIDRAMMATEPNAALLYYFFALSRRTCRFVIPCNVASSSSWTSSSSSVPEIFNG